MRYRCQAWGHRLGLYLLADQAVDEGGLARVRDPDHANRQQLLRLSRHLSAVSPGSLLPAPSPLLGWQR